MTYFGVRDLFVRAGRCFSPAFARIHLLCWGNAQQSCPISSQLLLSAASLSSSDLGDDTNLTFSEFLFRFFLCFNFYPSNTFCLFVCFLFPFQSIIINIGELWVLYQFCRSVVLSLSILLRLFCFFSLVYHWGFGAPLHMLMTATSCAAQKIPLIYKFPRASLPMNNPVAPAPGWVCEAPNDGFVQGTTTKHLRGDRWEACAESFVLPDACTNSLPIPTLTPLWRWNVCLLLL